MRCIDNFFKKWVLSDWLDSGKITRKEYLELIDDVIE